MKPDPRGRPPYDRSLLYYKQKKFIAFHEANPDIYGHFSAMATTLRAYRNHGSANSIISTIRYRHDTRIERLPGIDEFAIPSAFESLYARLYNWANNTDFFLTRYMSSRDIWDDAPRRQPNVRPPEQKVEKEIKGAFADWRKKGGAI